jgi:type IV pilus biogenesis protein CpaD/CtpE
MRPESYLIILSLTLLISGCAGAPEPVVVTVPKIIRNEIPVVVRPKPVTLTNTRIYVVTADNYDSFVEEFEAKNGELVYVAISIKDYENLSINISELRRFINQQKEIIVYYEEAISANPSEESS